MHLYPANLNIAGRLCVVIGGGKVAARKVSSLVECGADIVVISPTVSERMAELLEVYQIQWQQRGYQPGDIRDAFLCIAATDNRKVQEEVRIEAEQEKVLLNSIDDPVRCDFQVPSKVRRGGMLLTISTGGASPALSKSLRQQLEEEYGPEYAVLVKMLHLIRQQIVGDGREVEEHTRVFKKLVQQDFLSLFAAGEWTEVKRVLLLLLPEQYAVTELVAILKKEWEESK